MNAYGELARDLWRAADELRFSQMPCRDDFFRDLGEQIAHRVEELIPLFAGVAPPSEPGRRRHLRLRKAQKQAEELAYQELLFSHSVVPADELVDA